MKDFYKNKNVLITGHTGFKGAWLSQILVNWGANVSGYSLNPPTDPNLFNLLDLVGKNMTIYQTKTEDKDKLSVRIKIEEGTENKDKIEEIKKFLEKANGTFNISFKYNSDGKLNIILIEPYIENQNQ